MARGVAHAAATGVGWGLGVGAAFVVAGALTGGVRPLVKGVIRGGVAVAERAQVLAAEGGEMVGDLYHEVVDERSAEREAREAYQDARSHEVVVFPEGSGR